MKYKIILTKTELNRIIDQARLARDINQEIKDYRSHPSQEALDNAYEASREVVNLLNNIRIKTFETN